jgi:hypothetical protein
VLEAPRLGSSPETGGCGLLGRSVLVLDEDRLARPGPVRTVEVACRVAVARDDAPGVELGADPADRSVVNVGSVPAVPAKPLGLGAGVPSAVAAGAWRRTRSSRGSSAPSRRAGKPSTGRRGPVSTRHGWTGGGRL